MLLVLVLASRGYDLVSHLLILASISYFLATSSSTLILLMTAAVRCSKTHCGGVLLVNFQTLSSTCTTVYLLLVVLVGQHASMCSDYLP
jgi:hypothetical protein